MHSAPATVVDEHAVMTSQPYAYIAGPLFDDGERWFIDSVEARVAALGFRTFLPHRDNPPKTPDTVRTIYDNDRTAIERCDLIVANLNGIMTDDGTAWELGCVFALRKTGDSAARATSRRAHAAARVARPHRRRFARPGDSPRRIRRRAATGRRRVDAVGP
jgi:nucleoside 2-deoxyribosyltransferase